jgi:uracil-DNA glycosylase family 4
VGESPTEADFREGAPFDSNTPTGKKLDEVLDSTGLGRRRMRIVTAIACAPKEPLRTRELAAAVKCCRPLLFDSLRGYESKPFIVMGALALEGLDGRKKSVGALRGFIDTDWRLDHGGVDQVGEEVEGGGGRGRSESE